MLRLLLLLTVLTTSLYAQDDRLPDVNQWTGSPPLGLVSVSASGRWLAGYVRGSNRTGLAIWPVNVPPVSADGRVAKEVFLTGFGRDSADWYRWVGNDRFLVHQQREKDASLVIFEGPDFRSRDLLQPEFLKGKTLPLSLISVLRNDPDHILVTTDGEQYGYATVYRLNLDSGEMTVHEPAMAPVVRWKANQTGHVGIGIGFKARRHIVFVRSAEGTSWKEIRRSDYLAEQPFEMLGVAPDGKTGYALTTDESGALQSSDIDLSDGKVIRRYANTAPWDHKGILVDRITGKRLGVVWHGHDRHVGWTDPDHAALRARIADSLGSDRFLVTGRSLDRSVVALIADPETAPARPWVWLEGEGRLVPIGPDPTAPPGVASELVRVDVGATQPMEGLLYRAKADGPAKAVVLVHGGPVRRDTTDWKPVVQMLVASGYTVLRPNFRGSTGYGENWRRAGFVQWGALMQDDLLAAGKWLVKEGLARPDRLCMAGGSYGGYAALMSVIRHHKTFRCAASWNGVTDLPDLIEHFSRNRFAALSVPRIQGELKLATLKKRSPLYQARKIRRPVLLLQGLVDDTVPATQSIELALRLKKIGKPFRFVPLENAGHTLSGKADKKIWFTELRTFLDQAIGPKRP